MSRTICFVHIIIIGHGILVTCIVWKIKIHDNFQPRLAGNPEPQSLNSNNLLDLAFAVIEESTDRLKTNKLLEFKL